MIAEIVCVGTELLLGQITNTNARFLAETLAGLGIDAYFQQVVGDNAGRVRQALELALSRSDLVVTSGGLGPTEDDLTKEVVSEILGLRLVPDPAVAEAVVCVLERHRSQALPEAVAKQSLVTEGAVVLPNPVGTAPGLLVSKDGKHVALLPGPPAELVPIVREHLIPRLEALLAAGAPAGRSFLVSRVVKLCGIGEPAVEKAVRDLVHSANPTVAPLVSVGETHLRITAKAARPDRAHRLADEMVGAIRSRLAEHIFGYDDDTIAGACGKLLRRERLTLALAESLTGGLVGHLITQVPGSSDYFERGFVVYSNRAKTELLGVPPELLARHGAVSEEVALAMARGARERSGTDLAVALTGIAGPTGGSPAKPVGLVYIALSDGRSGRVGPADPRPGPEELKSEPAEPCFEFRFTGDRDLVKQRAAHRALVILWEHLRR